MFTLNTKQLKVSAKPSRDEVSVCESLFYAKSHVVQQWIGASSLTEPITIDLSAVYALYDLNQLSQKCPHLCVNTLVTQFIQQYRSTLMASLTATIYGFPSLVFCQSTSRDYASPNSISRPCPKFDLILQVISSLFVVSFLEIYSTLVGDDASCKISPAGLLKILESIEVQSVIPSSYLSQARLHLTGGGGGATSSLGTGVAAGPLPLSGYLQNILSTSPLAGATNTPHNKPTPEELLTPQFDTEPLLRFHSEFCQAILTSRNTGEAALDINETHPNNHPVTIDELSDEEVSLFFSTFPSYEMYLSLKPKQSAWLALAVYTELVTICTIHMDRLTKLLCCTPILTSSSSPASDASDAPDPRIQSTTQGGAASGSPPPILDILTSSSLYHSLSKCTQPSGHQPQLQTDQTLTVTVPRSSSLHAFVQFLESNSLFSSITGHPRDPSVSTAQHLLHPWPADLSAASSYPDVAPIPISLLPSSILGALGLYGFHFLSRNKATSSSSTPSSKMSFTTLHFVLMEDCHSQLDHLRFLSCYGTLSRQQQRYVHALHNMVGTLPYSRVIQMITPSQRLTSAVQTPVAGLSTGSSNSAPIDATDIPSIQDITSMIHLDTSTLTVYELVLVQLRFPTFLHTYSNAQTAQPGDINPTLNRQKQPPHHSHSESLLSRSTFPQHILTSFRQFRLHNTTYSPIASDELSTLTKLENATNRYILAGFIRFSTMVNDFYERVLTYGSFYTKLRPNVLQAWGIHVTQVSQIRFTPYILALLNRSIPSQKAFGQLHLTDFSTCFGNRRQSGQSVEKDTPGLPRKHLEELSDTVQYSLLVEQYLAHVDSTWSSISRLQSSTDTADGKHDHRGFYAHGQPPHQPHSGSEANIPAIQMDTLTIQLDLDDPDDDGHSHSVGDYSNSGDHHKHLDHSHLSLQGGDTDSLLDVHVSDVLAGLIPPLISIPPGLTPLSSENFDDRNDHTTMQDIELPNIVLDDIASRYLCISYFLPQTASASIPRFLPGHRLCMGGRTSQGLQLHTMNTLYQHLIPPQILSQNAIIASQFQQYLLQLSYSLLQRVGQLFAWDDRLSRPLKTYFYDLITTEPSPYLSLHARTIRSLARPQAMIPGLSHSNQSHQHQPWSPWHPYHLPLLPLNALNTLRSFIASIFDENELPTTVVDLAPGQPSSAHAGISIPTSALINGFYAYIRNLVFSLSNAPFSVKHGVIVLVYQFLSLVHITYHYYVALLQSQGLFSSGVGLVFHPTAVSFPDEEDASVSAKDDSLSSSQPSYTCVSHHPHHIEDDRLGPVDTHDSYISRHESTQLEQPMCNILSSQSFNTLRSKTPSPLISRMTKTLLRGPSDSQHTQSSTSSISSSWRPFVISQHRIDHQQPNTPWCWIDLPLFCCGSSTVATHSTWRGINALFVTHNGSSQDHHRADILDDVVTVAAAFRDKHIESRYKHSIPSSVSLVMSIISALFHHHTHSSRLLSGLLNASPPAVASHGSSAESHHGMASTWLFPLSHRQTTGTPQPDSGGSDDSESLHDGLTRSPWFALGSYFVNHSVDAIISQFHLLTTFCRVITLNLTQSLSLLTMTALKPSSSTQQSQQPQDQPSLQPTLPRYIVYTASQLSFICSLLLPHLFTKLDLANQLSFMSKSDSIIHTSSASTHLCWARLDQLYGLSSLMPPTGSVLPGHRNRSPTQTTWTAGTTPHAHLQHAITTAFLRCYSTSGPGRILEPAESVSSLFTVAHLLQYLHFVFSMNAISITLSFISALCCPLVCHIDDTMRRALLQQVDFFLAKVLSGFSKLLVVGLQSYLHQQKSSTHQPQLPQESPEPSKDLHPSISPGAISVPEWFDPKQYSIHISYPRLLLDSVRHLIVLNRRQRLITMCYFYLLYFVNASPTSSVAVGSGAVSTFHVQPHPMVTFTTDPTVSINLHVLVSFLYSLSYPMFPTTSTTQTTGVSGVTNRNDQQPIANAPESVENISSSQPHTLDNSSPQIIDIHDHFHLPSTPKPQTDRGEPSSPRGPPLTMLGELSLFDWLHYCLNCTQTPHSSSSSYLSSVLDVNPLLYSEWMSQSAGHPYQNMMQRCFFYHAIGKHRNEAPSGGLANHVVTFITPPEQAHLCVTQQYAITPLFELYKTMEPDQLSTLVTVVQSILQHVLQRLIQHVTAAGDSTHGAEINALSHDEFFRFQLGKLVQYLSIKCANDPLVLAHTSSDLARKHDHTATATLSQLSTTSNTVNTQQRFNPQSDVYLDTVCDVVLQDCLTAAMILYILQDMLTKC